MSLSSARRAELALLGVALTWGLSFPWIKVALEHAPPFSFLALRFGIGLALFAPWMVKHRPTRAAWKPGLVLALLAAISYYAQTLGLVYTTPTRSAFITGLSVVIVPLCYPAITRRLPARWPVIGAAIATGGLFLLTAPGGGGWNRGDALTLLTAVAYALYVIALETATRRNPYMPILGVQMLVLGVVFLPGAVLETGPVRWVPGLWVPVLGTAVILVFSLYLQNRFQRDTTATRAAVIFTAEPVFAAAFSYLMLGETLAAAQWAGAALILAAILVAEKR